MKHIITTILAIGYLIVLGTGVTAQKGRVEISPVIESKNIGSGFVGWSDKYYFEVSYGGRAFATTKIYLRKYDKKLNFVSETLLPFNPDKDKSLSIEGVTVLNGKMMILSSRTDRRKKTQEFFYQVVSSKDELSPPVAIIQTQFDEESKVRNYGISYKVSPEQNYLMVYQTVPTQRTDNEKLNVYVFDQDMKLFWKKSVELEYSSKYTSISKYEVSDMGSAYIHARVSRADKEVEEVAKKREKEKSEGVKRNKQTERTAHFVYTFSPGGDEVQKYMIELGNENFPTAILTTFMPDGTIAIGGFYTDNNVTTSVVSIQGVFYMTLDLLQKQMTKPKTQKIPDATRRLLLGNKAVEKGRDKTGADFLVRYFKAQEDGSILLVAEEFYITTHTVTDSKGFTRTYTVYHYEDIMVLKLDGDGNVKWSNVISKVQVAGFHSFSLRVVDENIYIVYNDNIENLDVTKLKTNRSGDLKIKQFNPRGKAASVLVTITPDGKMKKEEIMKRADKMGIMDPTEIMSVEPENILLGKSISGGRRVRLVRIHLK